MDQQPTNNEDSSEEKSRAVDPEYGAYILLFDVQKLKGASKVFGYMYAVTKNSKAKVFYGKLQTVADATSLSLCTVQRYVTVLVAHGYLKPAGNRKWTVVKQPESASVLYLPQEWAKRRELSWSHCLVLALLVKRAGWYADESKRIEWLTKNIGAQAIGRQVGLSGRAVFPILRDLVGLKCIERFIGKTPNEVKIRVISPFLQPCHNAHVGRTRQAREVSRRNREHEVTSAARERLNELDTSPASRVSEIEPSFTMHDGASSP